MTRHEAALFVTYVADARDQMLKENKAGRVERRSRNFLAKLSRDCGRPAEDSDDAALSLAICEVAARAKLESPTGLQPPPWALEAMTILRSMQMNLPESIPRRVRIQTKFEEHFPGKTPPLHEADPSLHLCQVKARAFFFGFGMPEEEEFLACCLLAYAEGWVPSEAWHDLEEKVGSDDLSLEPLVHDINSTLAERAEEDCAAARERSQRQMTTAIIAGIGAGVAFLLNGPAALVVGALVVAVALGVSAHNSWTRGEEFRREAKGFRRSRVRGRGFPRILPHSIPVPPPPLYRPSTPDAVVEGHSCSYCGGTWFTKTSYGTWGCRSCGNLS